MALSLVTAPAVEPIERDTAKEHLRVSLTEEDELVDALIVAARERAEHVTKRALITQVWDWKLDAFPSGTWCYVPRPPLLSIGNITYLDTAGASQTLATTVYTSEAPAGPQAEPGRLALKYGQSWPSTYGQIAAVTVRFTAGYGADPEDVPQAIRQAMLLMIGHWYANRESVVVGTIASELPMAAMALLRAFDAGTFGMAA